MAQLEKLKTPAFLSESRGSTSLLRFECFRLFLAVALDAEVVAVFTQEVTQGSSVGIVAAGAFQISAVPLIFLIGADGVTFTLFAVIAVARFAELNGFVAQERRVAGSVVEVAVKALSRRFDAGDFRVLGFAEAGGIIGVAKLAKTIARAPQDFVGRGGVGFVAAGAITFLIGRMLTA